jgi:hypothetical protein
MSAKSDLVNRQRAWASSVGLKVDDRGYFSSIQANLFQPLSIRAGPSFAQGSGSELTDTRNRPAKMKALHSSAALAVNVFDYWAEREAAPLFSALKLKESPARIKFEAQFPTGLEGIPPNLDLALEFENSRVVGVESKFSEWLTPKPPKKKWFKPKYFPASTKLWSEKGLLACQLLAEELNAGTRHYRYLDAGQLLKHALGLATQQPGKFELYYLYFDWPGRESAMHGEEVQQFSGIVSHDFKFTALSYQELYKHLSNEIGAEHAEYMTYLRLRYF